MSPRMATLPPTEPAMWRKLLAAAHPDQGGDHELFIWTMHVREQVCNGDASGPGQRREPPRGNSDAVPFEGDYDHEGLTASALQWAEAVSEPYASCLRLLTDCEEAFFGPTHDQQYKGATYKQLAAIGHTVGMDLGQRCEWYQIAEAIPLSRRHAGHILSKLKKAAA